MNELTESFRDGDVGEYHDDGHHDDGRAQRVHHVHEGHGAVVQHGAEGRRRQPRQARLHASCPHNVTLLTITQQ